MAVINLTPRQPRLYVLDGLRGLCAIALMFYHLFAWNGTSVFQIGTFGVYLFYVLSGFSMWYVYAPRKFTAEMVKAFFVARFARIFPLYFLVSLVAVLARLYAQGGESMNAGLLQRFILNITFLFGLNDPGKTAIMPGGWSIGIEWVFYFIFPLFLLFSRSLNTMKLLLILGMVINAVTASVLFPNGTLEAQWNLYTQFPTFFMYFIAGILAAEIFRTLPADRAIMSPQLNAWLCRIIPIGSVALIFLYPSRTTEEYLYGPHVMVLVLVSMLALISGSMLKNITRWEIKLYSFLGEISYSTYLLFFFIYSLTQAILKHVYPAYPFALLVIISTVSTLAASYLVYRFYEMPARQWLKRRFQ